MPRCKICRDKFEAKYFLQKACLKPVCLAEWSKLDREKKADDKRKARKKEFNNNDKSLRTKAAQMAFNAYIRFRDSNLGCVSCDKPAAWGGQWHCGHFKTTRARPDLRFEESNAARQCSQCNNFLSGNIIEYKKELIKRIGVNVVSDLDVVIVKKYSCDDLKNIEVYYKELIKK